jgi:uncharacterized protein (DUF433 family)
MPFQWQDYIANDPEICAGLPTMKGTRVLLRQLLADVAVGTSASDIVAAYPSLTPDHVKAAIAFAALQQDQP